MDNRIYLVLHNAYKLDDFVYGDKHPLYVTHDKQKSIDFLICVSLNVKID